MGGFEVMEAVVFVLVFAAVSAKYRGNIRKGLEKLTGIKTVREGVYQGGLDDQTYEGIILETPLVILAMAVFFYYPFVVSLNNFPIYLGFITIFLFPFLILLLRIRIFSDSSILERTGIGYHPAYCFLLSIFAGGFTTGTGFSMLNFPEDPVGLAYSMIIVGLIAQAIPLFPDYINKILPFEIRSKFGYKFMVVLAIVIFFATWLIHIYLQSQYM
ncbi:MAG: hypothetical protein HVN34_07710 [Methanobacteriaceae archaeon]|jgi:hypothetical protein|nr:hypothetical protein [Methanobacteriaceae archaeon]OPY22666.1 MAG: hypothetical protein A4E27_01740 [Methanobacterium sp. PtaU1.Bin242]